MSFATNHDLSLVNTFFRTPKGGISHTFNGRGKKRIDYILTRQQDRKLARNVTVQRQPSLHPMFDHNVVSAPVKLLGHFSRNRRCHTAVKPTIDRQRLTTDPDLRKEVADATGNFLRANPPSGSSIDEMESAFTEAIMRTAEQVVPKRERGRRVLAWSRDPQTEAELRVALVSRRKAWQHQNANRKDSQSKRAVRRAKVELKKTREAGVVRFIERLVGEIEEKLQRRDQRGLFHLLKSTQVEEVRKVNSQYIRDEQGELLRDADLIRERWVRHFRSMLNAKSRPYNHLPNPSAARRGGTWGRANGG